MKKKYFYGYEISEYGVENGYIDYRTLSKVVGNTILNNQIITQGELEDWELCNQNDYDEKTGEFIEIFQYYIITNQGADFLCEHTNEIVYYNAELNMHLWAITHYGTAWDYVLTDIPIPEQH